MLSFFVSGLMTGLIGLIMLLIISDFEDIKFTNPIILWDVFCAVGLFLLVGV